MLDRLISGADRDTKQMLADRRPDGNFEPAEYDLFFPMALGKIGTLPSPALRSRCIVIQMHPATAEEAAILGNQAKGQADPNIRPLLARVVKAVEADIVAAKPAIPTNLINRSADKWRPLLAIAEAAGSDWPKRALAAANELESGEEEELPHITLLRKLVAFTKDWPHEVIFSEELDRMRVNIDDNFGRLTAKTRAGLLELVGLKPKRHWRDGKQLRGYLIADIRNAAAKYIRPDTCDE